MKAKPQKHERPRTGGPIKKAGSLGCGMFTVPPVAPHSSEVAARVTPRAQRELWTWVVRTSQRRVLRGDKCPTLVGAVDNGAGWGGTGRCVSAGWGENGTFLYLPLSFALNPKLF